ncbi:MAG: SMP-30/gluconolactonase/LRE family protein [Anaerolineae bacterium]
MTALLPITNFAPFVEGLDHPEGVAWGPDGFVYAGGEAGQIYKIAPDGSSVTELGSTGGFILGIALDAALNVYACDMGNGAIFRITQSGDVTKYSDYPEAIPAPNYPVFDQQGNLYFSSSGAFRQNNGRLFRARPGGHTEVISTAFTAFPNGLALSPDGRYLYVVLSTDSRVARAEIRADGTLSDPEPVCSVWRTIPDGLAFDEEGNLYIACYTPDVIFRCTPAGVVDVFAEDWESVTFATPTNIAFGGPDLKTLFVASLSRWHLTKGPVPVAGARLNYPAI